LAWLQQQGDLCLRVADVRDASAVADAAVNQDAIYHLAAQVAVTTSVQDPREDFEINALGTFNVLEAARQSASRPLVVYASTNKVYGGMEAVPFVEGDTRYAYADLPFGVPEDHQLDFHSPYGCSKGAGDQYTRDYFRIFGLRTVVFRQSCIYGPRQFGVEDQGWLAHFAISAATGRPVTIYGDGKQVRDVLWIDDLLNAYESVLMHPEVGAGEVFNLGGGPEFTLSIWRETGKLLESCAGHPVCASYREWRPADQRVYVSDIRKAQEVLGWKPLTSPEVGFQRLWAWVKNNFQGSTDHGTSQVLALPT
jgi:CDP-paratose 2-epimerase